MEELILVDNTFLVKDRKDFIFNENRILEVSKGLFVKVIICGTIQYSKDGEKLRVVQIVK